jgi:acyl carrier protein
MTIAQSRRAEVSDTLKAIVARESRLSIAPSALADDEPLNGELLKINSLGFLGMLVQLEDALDVTLLDDVFAGRAFNTVADLVDVVIESLEDER